jgi:3-isopropylmalate/(R)-2-methylmalate dehydratase small subunit
MIEGRAFAMGDFVNTDLLFTNKYDDRGQSLDEVAAHAVEGLPGLHPGDVIVGGTNFGAVSSREMAIKVMKKIGIRAVLAKSFARLFYRNAINNGLWAMDCDTSRITLGDLLRIDANAGRIYIPERNVTIETTPLPGFLARLVEAGGLLPYVRLRPDWL